MNAGVAGQADSDQQIGGVLARAAVMYRALIRRPANAAGMSVAQEDEVALTAEAGPGVDSLGIAGAAEPGDSRQLAAAGAEQQSLLAAHGWAMHKGARGPL
jgi:hypothetical protein